MSGCRCWEAPAGWWWCAAAGGSGGLRIVRESLLTLSGGGRVPCIWSSLLGDGVDVPPPEGNSGGFMVVVEKKKVSF